jgi:epoxyqueuosine reductase
LSLLPDVLRLLDDASPLVRGMAVWAFARLAGEDRIGKERARRLSVEDDQGVRAEWTMETV